jgi:hypothetical protein
MTKNPIIKRKKIRVSKLTKNKKVNIWQKSTKYKVGKK